MNTLDNLLLFVSVAVFLIYCYKKKKFIFSKFRKGEKTENEEQKTAQGIQPPVQIIPFYSQGLQMPASCSSAPIRTSQCKFVPWSFLPVFDMEKAQADETITNDVTALENALNKEIQSIALQGYIITGIDALEYDLGDPSVHILFCITFGR